MVLLNNKYDMENYNNDLVEMLKNLKLSSNNSSSNIRQDPRYKNLVGKSTKLDEGLRLKIMVVGSEKSVVELHFYINEDLRSPQIMRSSIVVDTSYLLSMVDKSVSDRRWDEVIGKVTFDSIYLNNNYVPTVDGVIKINTKEMYVVKDGDVVSFPHEDDFIQHIHEVSDGAVEDLVNRYNESDV